MDDAELNRKLAEAMGFELGTNKLGYNLSGPDTVLANKEDYFIEVHYKDPAIFAENVKWLIEHDWLIMEDAGVTIVDYRLYPFGDVQDTEPEKAVTLARLAATEIYKAGE